MFSFVFSGTLHSFISYNGPVNLMVTLRHPKSLWTSSRNECTALSPMGLLVVARSASCYEDEFFWCFPWQSKSVCYCLTWQSVCCCLLWQSVCYLQWQSELVTICLFLSSVTTSLLLSSLIIRLLLFFCEHLSIIFHANLLWALWRQYLVVLCGSPLWAVTTQDF